VLRDLFDVSGDDSCGLGGWVYVCLWCDNGFSVIDVMLSNNDIYEYVGECVVLFRISRREVSWWFNMGIRRLGDERVCVAVAFAAHEVPCIYWALRCRAQYMMILEVERPTYCMLKTNVSTFVHHESDARTPCILYFHRYTWHRWG
jgi:hypothetical protein